MGCTDPPPVPFQYGSRLPLPLCADVRTFRSLTTFCRYLIETAQAGTPVPTFLPVDLLPPSKR